MSHIGKLKDESHEKDEKKCKYKFSHDEFSLQ